MYHFRFKERCFLNMNQNVIQSFDDSIFPVPLALLLRRNFFGSNLTPQPNVVTFLVFIDRYHTSSSSSPTPIIFIPEGNFRRLQSGSEVLGNTVLVMKEYDRTGDLK